VLNQLVELQPAPHPRTLSPGLPLAPKWRLVARSLTTGRVVCVVVGAVVSSPLGTGPASSSLLCPARLLDVAAGSLTILHAGACVASRRQPDAVQVRWKRISRRVGELVSERIRASGTARGEGGDQALSRGGMASENGRPADSGRFDSYRGGWASRGGRGKTESKTGRSKKLTRLRRASSSRTAGKICRQRAGGVLPAHSGCGVVTLAVVSEFKADNDVSAGACTDVD
jgi:hypothetical protein